MTGTFPYYSDGVPGEKYGAGNYKATNGRLYKVSTSGAGTPLAWYPAPGFRYATSGVPSGVGYYGFGWSSITNGVYGLDLNFSSQGLYTSSSGHRAHGYPLRCLSE